MKRSFLIALAVSVAIVLVSIAGYSLVFPNLYPTATVRAEAPAGLVQLSLTKLNAPELRIAYALHPDFCTLGWPEDQKWTVMCRGVPIHFYRQITVCDPGPPKECGPAPAKYTDCRTFFWNVDAAGEPSEPSGRGKFASHADDCMPRGLLEFDHEEMARRGIALIPETIMDYAGSYTGKPRPIR